MTSKKYREIILDQLNAIGTYNQSFDTVIESLSQILEQRDKVYKEFKSLGGMAVIVHTNARGSDNLTKNPAISVWNELNVTALSYWKALGLTPSDLKKITGEAVAKEKKGSGLIDAIQSLEI